MPEVINVKHSLLKDAGDVFADDVKFEIDHRSGFDLVKIGEFVSIE